MQVTILTEGRNMLLIEGKGGGVSNRSNRGGRGSQLSKGNVNSMHTLRECVVARLRWKEEEARRRWLGARRNLAKSHIGRPFVNFC